MDTDSLYPTGTCGQEVIRRAQIFVGQRRGPRQERQTRKVSSRVVSSIVCKRVEN